MIQTEIKTPKGYWAVFGSLLGLGGITYLNELYLVSGGMLFLAFIFSIYILSK